MEFKTVVFNAARDGKLYRLKVFLDHKPKDEVKMLVSMPTNGATPLVMACRNGHLDVAVYLIEKCHADIEQVGSVTFDGETVEGAPPLWCAAAAGHLNLVRVLVRSNASLNSATKTNSTPLRAACFDGHLEIVKLLVEHGADIEIANKHGHTCLMIACYKGHFEIAKYLIDCGANFDRKSAKGNTALHDCAESGSLDILKLLLDHGAKLERDTCGATPFMTAAVTGQQVIVEFFIQEFNSTIEEKINALELLGATYMDKKRDMITALDCWRRAMELRCENDEHSLQKLPVQTPIASYIGATEVSTFQQLQDLLSDPDKMKIQALLMRERILGPGHPETIYYVRYRGATYADIGNFDRCIQLWIYALDVQQKMEEPLSPLTQSSLLGFAELFSYMLSKDWAFANRAIVAFRDILQVFKRTLKEIKTAMERPQKQQQDVLNDTNLFHRTLIIAMHLAGLMCKLQPHMDKSEELEFKRSVHQFVRINPRGKNGWTPLHLACYKDSSTLGRYPMVTFPSSEVVNLLLEVGACPNSLDYGGNTPLHIAAMNKPCAEAIFQSLLSHGAHLDISNAEKQTALELAQQTPSLDIYPLQYINLQCLCAQVIQLYEIPYKGVVQKKLEEFIDVH